MKLTYFYNIVLSVSVLLLFALSAVAEIVELNEKAFDAAEKGDLKLLQQLVESGADLKATKERGLTPLHIAAVKGHDDVLKYLVRHSVDINVKDIFGRTALLSAARAQQTDSVRLLIDLGANWNLTDNDHQTPLHVAAASGNLDLLKYLLEHSELESKDRWNKTALYKAVEKGHESAVRLLLEHGANPYSTGLLDYNLMHAAAENGHSGLVQELKRYKQLINAKNKLEDTPLFCAVDNNHTKTVFELVDIGAEVQREHLWKALGEFNFEVVKFLVEKSGDNNARYPSMTDCRNTLLMDVVGSAKHKPQEAVDLVAFLLDRGADINLTNCDGITALHVAAINGADESLLKVLVDKGANVNAKDSKGNTPLDYARGKTLHFLRSVGAKTGDQV